VVRLSTAAAGAALLGCEGSVSPRLPAAAQSGLDHIVIVTMENRSFDHFFGWVPNADGRQDGLSYVDRSGIAHPTHHLLDFQGCGFNDPDHSAANGRVEWNSGACDGWLMAGANDLYSIGYYVANDLAFLGQAAPQWTVCDRYFTAIMGPTLPNRRIALAGQTDQLLGSGPNTTLPTILDRLAAAGVPALNYGYSGVTANAWGSRYSSIIRPISMFYADAAAGTLPGVSWVDPDFAHSYTNADHPHDDIRNGEVFLADVYRAVTRGPAWPSTLLVITFDEWGGFFDHVSPPNSPVPPIEEQAGNYDGLRGFRIPTLLISPFARRRHVSSVVYDHASLLKLIEWRWGLDPLSVRDEQANNLALSLDWDHPDTAAPVMDVISGTYGAPCP
jgi:phospholipase C